MLDILRGRGIAATIAVWSDPNVDWSRAALCIIRSTWDYHTRHEEFMAWVDRVATSTMIQNDRALLRWSADKSYLLELQAFGTPAVPTAFVRHGELPKLAEISSAHGWRAVVIKPCRGAAAHEVLLVLDDPAAMARGQAHLDRLLRSGDVLVQPYLGSVVTRGERALVFFEGRYSHAVVKKPFDSVLAVSGARSAVVEATAREIAIATKALAVAPGVPLYARVDLLHGDDDRVFVSEVELVEPALYLRVHDPARIVFADAIERLLQTLYRPKALPTRSRT
jgi:glutathione synthase/RimK-type ligase-like ATP-grasp enzyme